jgi:DNA-binding transcriptional LysR family regulator
MHLSRIDLNLFVVFDAIYTEGGITRAGQRLNLSQPAISHALGRLRGMFDDPLFTRHGHAMAPTPMARQLIGPIRESLRGLEATLTRVDRFDPATATKRFMIGMRDVLESGVLTPLMREITRLAPGIDVSAVHADRRELEAELASGTLDAAVDVLLALSDDVRRQRISRERSIVVARRGHPAVRRGLDLKTYLAQEHIAVSARRRGLTAEDFELSRHNLSRRIRLRCQHYFAACRVVSQTDLLLTMSDRYARSINRQFGNQILPFPLAVPPGEIYVYWHANADADPASQWLRRQLLRTLRERDPR